MTSCIIVTPAGTACPVAPAPDTPRVERRIAEEVESRKVSLVHPLVIKRILQNPVPKGKTYD